MTAPDRILLADLTPAAVADEVWGWVVGHVSRQLMHGDIPPNTLAHGEMHARHAVECLTRYAQTGCELDAHPADYLQSVAELLWTAAHPDVYSTTDTIGEGRGEPEHAIDVVIRAALARDALAGPGRVPLVWVASLIGVTASHMRVLASREGLDVKDGKAACAETRRWLTGRGVRGLTPVVTTSGTT